MKYMVRAVALASLAATGSAGAQDYPVRPVRLVVPSSPGGTSDILGRLLAPKLGEALGQQVVVENRPGASSVIGADFVSKSAPDGYTMLISPAALAINPSMYAKMPFDARRDLAPISLVTQTANVLVVHPSVPARSVQELIALARKEPGGLASASPGIGGSPHLSVELFKMMAGIDVLVVTYKGAGPGVTALLSGEVSMMFTNPPTVRAHLKSGRMRALAVTTRSRNPALPDLPTIDEAGLAGYEAAQWFGLLAPARTPPAIVDRLQREANRILHAPEMKQRFAFEGLEVIGSKPEEFATFIASELDKWARVIKAAGIKPQGGGA